jgi:hypothetical protein
VGKLKKSKRDENDILGFGLKLESACVRAPKARGIERPRNELQTKVLIAKESQAGQSSDLGIRCARVLQETSPQLDEGIVVNHDDVLSGEKRTAPAGNEDNRGRRRSSTAVVPAKDRN